MKKLLICILLIFAMLTPALSYVPATSAFAAEVSVATPAKPYKIQNVVSGVHVYWNAVDGVEKYGLYRSENGANGTYKWIAGPTAAHFTDTKVESGKTYHYKVTAFDQETGKQTAKSPSIGIIFVSTPDITKRENNASGMKLTWEAVDGAAGYGIYRMPFDGSVWERITTVEGGSTLTWTDTGAKNGEVYKYTIRALAGSDLKTLSGCRSAGRTTVRLLSRAINSVTASSETSAKVSWTTSAVVTGYEVRFTGTDGTVKNFTVGNYKTGTKTFTGLATDTTYDVMVRGYKKVDGVGTFYSAWSDAKSVSLGTTQAEIPVPEKPYKAVNTVSGVHVYWKATEGTTKYGLWRSETGKDGAYKWIANPTTNHFTDTTAESGKNYYYKVTAMDSTLKNHGDKSEALGIIYVATPDITGRENTANGVALTWQKITGAKGYAVYRRPYGSTEDWVRLETIKSADTLNYTDTTAVDGTAYSYTIRALAGSDYKTLSGCRSNGRAMVRLNGLELSKTEVVDNIAIKATWKADTDVTGYELQAFRDGEMPITVKVNDAATETAIIDVEKEGYYFVQIRTYKTIEAGTFYSEWSDLTKNDIWVSDTSPTPTATPNPTPTVMPVTPEELCYKFNDFTYGWSYGMTYSIEQDGSIFLDFDALWGEIVLNLQEPVDMSIYTKVTAVLKSEVGNIAIKLYDENYKEVYVRYDGMTQGVGSLVFEPESNKKIYAIGLMASADWLEDYSMFEATVYSLTFHRPPDIPENALEYLNYGIYDNQAYISSVKSQYKDTITEVVIPSTIKGYPVTEIYDRAFSGCKSLKSIEVPEGVTSIGYSAFYGCKSLTEVNLPNSLTEIGGWAFEGVPWLENELAQKELLTVGSLLIKCSKDATNVVIPDNITTIGHGAFDECIYLKSVEIPDTVTYIGDQAFCDCTSLESITIPEGIEYIGYRTFICCESLKSIELPSSVRAIGDEAFIGCDSLTSIIIPDGVDYIGAWAFAECSMLRSVTMPESIRTICEGAFQECSNLKSITIPDGVTYIGMLAFKECIRLVSITIPESVDFIGEDVFSECDKMKYIYVKEGSYAEKWAKANGYSDLVMAIL